MSRYCQNCTLPKNRCVCASVQTLDAPPRIIILQHPTETAHAKNTVRLLSLCIPDLEVYVGERPEEFFTFLDTGGLAQKTTAVLFPNSHSKPLTKAPSSKPSPVETLIFIDASWRKAKKMWILNTWLHGFESNHIDQLEAGKYEIRKTRIPGALSTLEAVAQVLESQYQIDAQPLYQVFETFKRDWLKFVPQNN